jgi:hypothetical protein
MRAHYILVAAVMACLLATGCASNNKGKIEGTAWVSEAGYVKGQQLPAGTLGVDFSARGTMEYRIRSRRIPGTYSLGMGNTVTFHLEEALSNGKTHTETIVIEGDRMKMSDFDGTELLFRKAR